MPLLVNAGARNRGRQDFRKYLDKDNLPTREGAYLIRGDAYNDEIKEISVYRYRQKGLCCFQEDFGSSGTGENDATDCHVSVQFTGLNFIMWLGNDKKENL